MILAQKLELSVKSELKKIHDIKRMSKKQSEVAEEICHLIIANEAPEKWNENIEKYCKSPKDTNTERIKEVEGLAVEHQVDFYLASILYASKCNISHEEE